MNSDSFSKKITNVFFHDLSSLIGSLLLISTVGGNQKEIEKETENIKSLMNIQKQIINNNYDSCSEFYIKNLANRRNISVNGEIKNNSFILLYFLIFNCSEKCKIDILNDEIKIFDLQSVLRNIENLWNNSEFKILIKERRKEIVCKSFGTFLLFS